MIETKLRGDDRNAVRVRCWGGSSFRRRHVRPALGTAVLLALTFAFNLVTLVRAAMPVPDAAPALRTADLFALAALSQNYFESVPDPSALNVRKIIAFEENPRFVYLVAEAGGSLRRIVLLKPDTFVVDDRVHVSSYNDHDSFVAWKLLAEGQVKINDKTLSVTGPKGELRGETLLPKNATLQATSSGRVDNDSAEHGAGAVIKFDGQVARFLHVLQVRRPGDAGLQPRSEVVREDDGWRLTVTVGDQTLKLSLPDELNAAGTIAIDVADGEPPLKERLLPSGIMPHGAEGVALLKRWDTPYQGDGRPGWDTGRVAPELKKVVAENIDGRGRAVVFGCGTGTNAIYLASQGFEVTGIDVAPSALARAAGKAREAGVNVRWVLADVLAVPELQPFDFVFDRGCYHHVRQYNAAGYVSSVDRLSRPGTRVLILAGSANEERRAGPPKVKEEEIRNDFSELFDFQWLREIRFDSANPDSKGPLAWSVLLRRKEGKP
jgi:SAM-dependent methyltransferase